jgi:uncharacterized protein YbjT (DUF2867 family)
MTEITTTGSSAADILVVGASGATGLAVVRALARRGAAVRALIRDVAKEGLVREAGAHHTVVGDIRDPRVLQRAVQGCGGVYFIGPRFMSEEAQVGRAMVDAAIRGGVRRFVYSGVYHPSIDALYNHRAKLVVEDALYGSELEFTVLQPARFIHGPVLAGWRRVVDEGVFVDAFDPARPMAYVDYDDVAEVAAIALTESRLARGTFELAAPGEYTGHDLAAHLAQALGRPVRAEQVALEDYGPAGPLMANAYAREGFLRLRDYYDRFGFRGGNGLVLEAILGRAPTDVPAFIAKLMAGQSVDPA